MDYIRCEKIYALFLIAIIDNPILAQGLGLWHNRNR